MRAGWRLRNMLSGSNYRSASQSQPVAAGTASVNVTGDEFIKQDENKRSGPTVTAVGTTRLRRWGR